MKRFHFKKSSFILCLFCGLILSSCYSFTASSLQADIETVNIKPFPNNTAYNPDLSQQFTVDLQNRFLQRTNLKGATENPDLIIEGEITGYEIAPTSIATPTTSAQSGNVIQAAQNKLTITVRVHYENVKYPDDSFDRTYTGEAVFNNDLSMQDIETGQVKIATERIINLIFNDIVANW